MKKKSNIYYLTCVIFAVASCILFSAPCIAQSGDAGQAGEFLRYGVGARALGMGRAFTAIADDASAIYWNPAGLGKMDRFQVTTMYNKLFVDSRYLYLGGVLPLKGKGSLGLGFINLNTGDFERRNEFNETDGSTFSNNEIGLYASYGRKLFWRLYGGANLKLLQQKLDDVSESGTGIDVGLSLRPFLDRKINIGAAFQNIGGSLGDDDIPMSTKFGASYAFSDFTLAGEGLIMSDRELEPAVGVEYDYHRKFQARAGLNRTEYSFGLGISLKVGQIDFAYANHKEDLGSSVRVSFTYTSALPQCGDVLCPVEYTDCVYQPSQACDADCRSANLKVLEDYGNSYECDDNKCVASAYIYLAECDYLDNDWSEAIANYSQAEAAVRMAGAGCCQRQDIFTYENDLHYMESYMHLGQWQNALEIFEVKMEEKTRWEAIYDVGVCHLRLGDFTAAQEKFEELLQMSDPRFRRKGLAYLKLGEVLSESGDLNKVKQAIDYLDIVVHEYQTGLRCYPHFPRYGDNHIADDAQFMLGECYLKLGDTERALLEFAKVPRFYPDLNKVREAREKIRELLK